MRLTMPVWCRTVPRRLRPWGRGIYILLLAGEGEGVAVDDSLYFESVGKCVV